MLHLKHTLLIDSNGVRLFVEDISIRNGHLHHVAQNHCSGLQLHKIAFFKYETSFIHTKVWKYNWLKTSQKYIEITKSILFPLWKHFKGEITYVFHSKRCRYGSISRIWLIVGNGCCVRRVLDSQQSIPKWMQHFAKNRLVHGQWFRLALGHTSHHMFLNCSIDRHAHFLNNDTISFILLIRKLCVINVLNLCMARKLESLKKYIK